MDIDKIGKNMIEFSTQETAPKSGLLDRSGVILEN